MDTSKAISVYSERRLAPARSRSAQQDVTPTLRQTAYEEIRRRIVTREFRPGDYLNEARVSQLLGIGRTPVHQAFSLLELEQMVEILPRVGILIRPLSLDELTDIIEVRILNEVHCTRLAAARATRADRDRLDSILERSTDLVRTQDVEGMMNLDREFHRALAAASHSSILSEFVFSLNERSLRYWFMSLSTPEHLQRVQEQHEAIVAALTARDATAAETAMRHHIEEFRENIRDSI